MKRYTIKILKINSEYYFCEALSHMSGYCFDDVNKAIKSANIPIDIFDLYKKFYTIGNFDNITKNGFTRNQTRIIKNSIGACADLEIEEIIPKQIEYFLTPEENLENKKYTAKRINSTVDDIEDAETWENSLSEIDLKRLDILKKIHHDGMVVR